MVRAPADARRPPAAQRARGGRARARTRGHRGSDRRAGPPRGAGGPRSVARPGAARAPAAAVSGSSKAWRSAHALRAHARRTDLALLLDRRPGAAVSGRALPARRRAGLREPGHRLLGTANAGVRTCGDHAAAVAASVGLPRREPGQHLARQVERAIEELGAPDRHLVQRAVHRPLHRLAERGRVPQRGRIQVYDPVAAFPQLAATLQHRDGESVRKPARRQRPKRFLLRRHPSFERQLPFVKRHREPVRREQRSGIDRMNEAPVSHGRRSEQLRTVRADAVAQKAQERLRILGLDDFERGLVPGAKAPVGVSESGQRAPDRAVRHRERLEAESADAIERGRFHRAIADPAAQLVRGVRDPQVESRIAEGAGLLLDSQRRCRFVEPLDHLRAHRIEPELDAPALAIAERREVDAQVRQTLKAVARMHAAGSAGRKKAAGTVLPHPIELHRVEDLFALALALLEDELDSARERGALAVRQMVVEPEEVLQPERDAPAAAAATVLVAAEPQHRLRQTHARSLRWRSLARRRHDVQRELHAAILPSIITHSGSARSSGASERTASRLAHALTSRRPSRGNPSSAAADEVAAASGSTPADANTRSSPASMPGAVFSLPRSVPYATRAPAAWRSRSRSAGTEKARRVEITHLPFMRARRSAGSRARGGCARASAPAASGRRTDSASSACAATSRPSRWASSAAALATCGSSSGNLGSNASFTTLAPFWPSLRTAARASPAVASSRPSPLVPQERVGYPPGAVSSGPEKRIESGGCWSGSIRSGAPRSSTAARPRRACSRETIAGSPATQRCT